MCGFGSERFVLSASRYWIISFKDQRIGRNNLTCILLNPYGVIGLKVLARNVHSSPV